MSLPFVVNTNSGAIKKLVQKVLPRATSTIKSKVVLPVAPLVLSTSANIGIIPTLAAGIGHIQPKPSSLWFPGAGTGTANTVLKFEKSSNMKFNLPPHNWSLPVNPSKLNSSINSTGNTQTNHATRRAIMWYYGGADVTTNSGLLDTSGSNITGAAVTGQTTYSSTPADNFWGFQFLWNPTSLGAVTTRNSNVVPSVMDAHAWANGLFTAMEALQFTIVIDRVNDFACFKAAPGQAPYHTDFYGNSAGVQQNTSALITDLMKQGTMSDIEFIYKMINGSGQNGKVWQNGLGRTTADLSFLSPTAIAIQFGPNPDSLSYVGWVESLNVTHDIFTEDMIPIHSTVTVNFNAFSRVALGSKN